MLRPRALSFSSAGQVSPCKQKAPPFAPGLLLAVCNGLSWSGWRAASLERVAAPRGAGRARFAVAQASRKYDPASDPPGNLADVG